MTLQPDALHQEDAEADDTDELAKEPVEGDGAEDQESDPDTQDPEPNDQAGEESPEATPAEIEARARALGWKPKAELGHAPKGGVIEDPAEWVTRYEQNVPILTAANKRLEEALKKVNSRVDQEVATRTDRAIKAAKAAFERQLKTERSTLASQYDAWITQGAEPAEIQRRLRAKDAALAKADADAAKARDDEFAEPKAETKEQSGESAPEWQDAYADFEQRNSSWYGPNRGMSARAREIGAIVDQEGRFGDDPVGAFKEIEKRMRAEYADHPTFRARQPRTSAVATNGARGARGARSAPSLTGDDEKTFTMLFRQGAYGDPKTADKAKAMAEFAEDLKDV